MILGLCFTGCQAWEYSHAAFGFTQGMYPSTFFMATGFHGAHVIIGTIFLLVCWFRARAGHFRPDHHFGFEAAAWYWHFVDVVWLFLFICIYWWGSVGAPSANSEAFSGKVATGSPPKNAEKETMVRRIGSPPVSVLAAALALPLSALRRGQALQRSADGGAALRRLRPRSRRAGCGRRARRSSSMLILGALVVGLAILVEIEFAPPLWVHLLLWTPVMIGGAIAMLRPLKAWLIAMQYRHHLLGV